ncbi:MAG: ribonuclease Z [Gemmatimonadota bacterium]|nr:ribonuclease Z [Gemmatimonadota bacterium]MDE3127785.1 ribonuclease Z [Gemmatimonadota bacterium]
MSLTLTLLGTSASRPTVERNVASAVLVREGETLMFDCGEGTQRQMMRYGVSFSLRDIYFTHMHADHVIGVIGLLRTMALQGRTEPMRLIGPVGAGRHLKRAKEFGVDRITFPVEIVELDAAARVDYGEFHVVPFPVDHGPSLSLGYALVEPARKGRFNPDRARELGIPEGPLWGQIHRGQTVTLPDGREIAPAELVGPPRPGRTAVITGDTRPCDATVEMSRGADLLVHEATFADEEAERARETGHSTAREAADVAARAGVRRLVLTHLSARYSRDPSDLVREARDLFDNAVVARDGMEIDVPYRDTAAESGAADV